MNTFASPSSSRSCWPAPAALASRTRYVTFSTSPDSSSANRTACAETSIPSTRGKLPARSRENRPLPQPMSTTGRSVAICAREWASTPSSSAALAASQSTSPSGPVRPMLAQNRSQARPWSRGDRTPYQMSCGMSKYLLRDTIRTLSPVQVGEHAVQVRQFGLVYVRRLDRHQQAAGQQAEFAGRHDAAARRVRPGWRIPWRQSRCCGHRRSVRRRRGATRSQAS